MFHKPLETQLKQPLSILTTWLSVVTPAFDAARNSDSDNDGEHDDDPEEPYDD